MTATTTCDEALRLFAEETDASADLGRAPDSSEAIAAIHARHDAALVRLQAIEERTADLIEAHGDKSLRR